MAQRVLSEAWVPGFVSKQASARSQLGLSLLLGTGAVLALAALAQLRLPLSWTPVPITGQTFGVALISLFFGARRSALILASYLGLGFLGAPFFALMPVSGFLIGPTFGYLLGMFVASIVVGTLADRGHAKSFWTAFLSASCGSLCIFACGLAVLSYFVPAKALLAAGLFPFLLGDLVKNALAAFIASRSSKS